MRLIGIYATLFLFGCQGNDDSIPRTGPVENEYVELISLERADNGEPLPATIEIHRKDPFYVFFELRDKADRPAAMEGVALTPIQDCPCVWTAYRPGTKPNPFADLDDRRTVVFTGLCRLKDPVRIPIFPTRNWFVEAPNPDQKYTRYLQSPPPDGISPFATALGATHPEPGEYGLDLYTFPTIKYLRNKTVPGAPLLVWRGTLKILD